MYVLQKAALTRQCMRVPVCRGTGGLKRNLSADGGKIPLQ